VRTVKVSSEVGVDPKFLGEKWDLDKILAKSEHIAGIIIKIGAVIPFSVAKKEPPEESKEDIAKAARYAGNSLVAHVMASVLAQRFPPMNVHIPKTVYDCRKDIKHPSAAFSVYDYAPHVFPIIAGNLSQPEYSNLMRKCLDYAFQFALNKISCGNCSYREQLPAYGYVKGKVFCCQKPEDNVADRFSGHNFRERLKVCTDFGNDLNNSLKRRNGKEGLSAADIMGIVESSVAGYKSR